MSWGGGQRSAYGLHKLNPTPSGPTVVTQPPLNRAGSGAQTQAVERFDPDADRVNHFIQGVKNLQGQSSSSSSGSTRPKRTIHVHTAHLLMHTHMSTPTHNPNVGDTVDAHLSRWESAWEFALQSQFKANAQKEVKTGKEQMNKTGLEAALKKMGFQVSKEVLNLLMSAFQTCDPNKLSAIDNIDYNCFIQCCIFAEKNFKKKDGSTSSSASSPAVSSLDNAAKQDVGQNSKQPKNIRIG